MHLLVAALLLQITTLDEALQALDEQGAPAEVPYDIGIEAAKRLAPDTSEQDAERLCRIASTAAAHEELAGAIKRLVCARSQPAALRPLLAATSKLPAPLQASITASLDRPNPAWIQLLEDESPDVAAGAQALVGPVADPAWTRETLTQWLSAARHPAVARLAKALAHTRWPAKLYEQVVTLDDVDLRSADSLGTLLAGLAARDRKAADAAIAAARLGPGQAGLALRGLAGVPLARYDEVGPLLADGFESAKAADDPALLCAAMRGAMAQYVPEVVQTLPWLATSHPSLEVRVHAINALGKLGAADLRTVNPLIKCLAEGGAVGAAAHGALRDRTGKRMSSDVPTWEAWRDRAGLPADLSSSDAERLGADRAAYADLQRREEKRREYSAAADNAPPKPAPGKPAPTTPAKPTSPKPRR